MSPALRRGALTLAAVALTAGVTAFTTPPRVGERPRADGVSYQFRITTAESDASFAEAGKTLQQMMGKAIVAGDRARLEFAEVKGAAAPGMSKDGYIILRDGGETMLMVNAKEKSYLELKAGDLAAMTNGLGGPSGMFKMDVTDLSMNVRELGAGEPMLGYGTTKYELVQNYTMTVKVMGFGNTTRNESTTTLWFAKGLAPKELMNPWADAARSMASMFKGNAAFEELMTGPQRKLPTDAVVRSESRAKSTTEKGQSTYTLSTTELTDWKKGSFDGDLFEVPKGYTKTELPDLAEASEAMKSSGMDTLDLQAAMKQAGFGDEDIATMMASSAMDGLREGLREGTKAAAKEAAGDAVKRGLGGLLRRKKP